MLVESLSYEKCGKIPAKHRETPGISTVSMAYYCKRSILLKQAGFCGVTRLLQHFFFSHGEKIAKFHMCSVHRAIYDC